MILQKMKKTAEDYLGTDVSEAYHQSNENSFFQ
jgi:molecular chaperone DnaK (HSP70)